LDIWNVNSGRNNGGIMGTATYLKYLDIIRNNGDSHYLKYLDIRIMAG